MIRHVFVLGIAESIRKRLACMGSSAFSNAVIRSSTPTEIPRYVVAYLALVALIGQTLHRVIAYGIFIASLIVFIYKTVTAPHLYWERRGIDLFLSVNISPKDFYFIDVYDTIANLVQQYEVNPGKLRLEITETVMMSDIANRLRIIERLRTDGFLVEMDDFGSGYSSLNMLKDIPVDVLKIDMMFLYKTKDQNKAHTILQTIINLTGDLGISSVTEGVETEEQHSMLVDMGCNMFQGYFFAKPMPVDEFEMQYKVA